MRIVETDKITTLVERLCIDANCIIGNDILESFSKCASCEKSALGREILQTLSSNAQIARTEMSPICQDTGMTVVFVTMGQEVRIEGGFLEDAINEGETVPNEVLKEYENLILNPIEKPLSEMTFEEFSKV